MDQNMIATDFFTKNCNPLPDYLYTTLIGVPETILQDALLEENNMAVKVVTDFATKHHQPSYLKLLKDFKQIETLEEKMHAWNTLVEERWNNLVKAIQTAGFLLDPDKDIVPKVHHDAFIIIQEYIRNNGTQDELLSRDNLPMSAGTIIRSVLCNGIIPTSVLKEIIDFSNGLVYSRGAGSGYYEAALMKCGANTVIAVDLPDNEYIRAKTIMHPIITDDQRDLNLLQKMAINGGCVWYNWPAQGTTNGYHGLIEAIDLGFRKFVICGDFSFAWSNPTELTSPMFPPTFVKNQKRIWKLKKVRSLIPWSQKFEYCLAWFWELNIT